MFDRQSTFVELLKFAYNAIMLVRRGGYVD